MTTSFIQGLQKKFQQKKSKRNDRPNTKRGRDGDDNRKTSTSFSDPLSSPLSPRNKKKDEKKKRKTDENGEHEQLPSARKKKKKSDARAVVDNDKGDFRKESLSLTKMAMSSSNNNISEESNTNTLQHSKQQQLNISAWRYIMAPMVGASELPFRLLCRKYGTQLAYTPMMQAHEFVHNPKYRHDIFATIPYDRPLVCHFGASNAQDFRDAAIVCAKHDYADMIDLNLGCPQRTAYLGHYGSYLLDESDRELVIDMVRQAVQATSRMNKPLPVSCKIRLLDTFEATMTLCRQLAAAGASVIAIHARPRASWDRKGPGARDGPAKLDWVAKIVQELNNSNVSIITNGNTVTYSDVVENLEETGAPGIMSAEGLLDDPALFLQRHVKATNGDGGNDNTAAKEDVTVSVPILTETGSSAAASSPMLEATRERHRKLVQKLEKVKKVELKLEKNRCKTDAKLLLSPKEYKRLESKGKLVVSLAKLDEKKTETPTKSLAMKDVSLADLQRAADDKVGLALEYLDLVDYCHPTIPTQQRTVVFHTRRILKDLLERYQLMPACLACHSNTDEVRQVVLHIRKYQQDPESFVYDSKKARESKEALERQKHEEGKRKRYEARMMRKAKREGKADLCHYLHVGAAIPTSTLVEKLLNAAKSEESQQRSQLEASWKREHSQHCLAHHLEPGGCPRGRACAFLHVDVVNRGSGSTDTLFVEQDEVAG